MNNQFWPQLSRATLTLYRIWTIQDTKTIQDRASVHIEEQWKEHFLCKRSQKWSNTCVTLFIWTAKRTSRSEDWNSLRKKYRRVPKLTTVVTFGFSTLLLSLLSQAHNFQGVITFGWLKHVLHMGNSKNKIPKNLKGILFEKRHKCNVYPVL